MGQNKRKQRTEALTEVIARRRIGEMAVEAREQHKFDKLVKQGIIVKE